MQNLSEQLGSPNFQKRALYLFLISLVLGFFLINFPGENHTYEAIVFSCIASIGFMAGSVAVSIRTSFIISAIILTFLIFTFRFINYYSESNFFEVISILFTIALLGVLTYRIIKRVFDKGDVTTEKLVGAVIIYLLIGVIWGNAYVALSIINENSFHFNNPPANLFKLHKELIYYSFITLTTVGFGDITALTPMAKSFTILEACIGVLFPNILIARLVSLEIMHSQSKKNH